MNNSKSSVLHGQIIRVLLFWGMCSLASAGNVEPVAMVTDLEGNATLMDQSRKLKLSILADIKSGAQLQLDDGARAIIVYLASGQEYELKGPSTAQFAHTQPETLSGNKIQARGLVLAKGGNDFRIKPMTVSQAAIVMRSAKLGAKLKLLNLTGTRTLASHPIFLWQPMQPDITYRLELSDDVGKSLFQTTTKETSLELPKQIQLQEGINYTWQVSATLPDGKTYSNTGDFSVAPSDLRAQVEKLRPQTDAPISERVAFASWLDQMSLKDEARSYWKALSKDRPEDSTLKALASK